VAVKNVMVSFVHLLEHVRLKVFLATLATHSPWNIADDKQASPTPVIVLNSLRLHLPFRAAFGGMLLEWAMVEQDAGGLAREERRWDGLPARESPNNVPMPFTNVATAGFPKDSIRGSAGCADLIGRIMMPHTPP
jgi:hypothetical protein